MTAKGVLPWEHWKSFHPLSEEMLDPLASLRECISNCTRIKNFQVFYPLRWQKINYARQKLPDFWVSCLFPCSNHMCHNFLALNSFPWDLVSGNWTSGHAWWIFFFSFSGFWCVRVSEVLTHSLQVRMFFNNFVCGCMPITPLRGVIHLILLLDYLPVTTQWYKLDNLLSAV